MVFLRDFRLLWAEQEHSKSRIHFDSLCTAIQNQCESQTWLNKHQGAVSHLCHVQAFQSWSVLNSGPLNCALLYHSDPARMPLCFCPPSAEHSVHLPAQLQCFQDKYAEDSERLKYWGHLRPQCFLWKQWSRLFPMPYLPKPELWALACCIPSSLLGQWDLLFFLSAIWSRERWPLVAELPSLCSVITSAARRSASQTSVTDAIVQCERLWLNFPEEILIRTITSYSSLEWVQGKNQNEMKKKNAKRQENKRPFSWHLVLKHTGQEIFCISVKDKSIEQAILILCKWQKARSSLV